MINTKNHFLKKSLKDKYFLNKLKFLDQYNRCKHDSMLRVENRVYANVCWDRFSFDNSRTHSHLMRSRQKIVAASSVNPNTSQNSSLKKPKFFLHQTFKTLNKKKQPLDSLFQLRKILTQMDQNGISFGAKQDLSLPIKHRILLKRSYFLAGILCLNLNNKRKELYGVSYWNQQWLFNEFFDWLFSSILGHCVENILIKYGKKSNVQKERFKELYLTYCSLSASFLDVLEPVEMENLLKVECLFFNKTNLLRQIRLILHIYHPWFFKTLTKKQQFNFFKTIITKTY